MVRKMRITSIIAVLLLSFVGFGQVSFNAGGSMLKQFSPTKPWAGFHLGFEIPRDDEVSIYFRFTHLFANQDNDSADVYVTARDINALPPGSYIDLPIKGMASMNYNILEGGTRYYLGNGYDFGWSAYGGSNMMLVFNKVKMEYEPYDEELYEVNTDYDYAGSIFGLGFGLLGGVKYSAVPYGTFYLDAGMNYIIFAQGSTPGVYGGLYNQLMFTVNIGYRKDILW